MELQEVILPVAFLDLAPVVPLTMEIPQIIKDDLSPREMLIATYWLMGKKQVWIAKKLNITPASVWQVLQRDRVREYLAMDKARAEVELGQMMRMAINVVRKTMTGSDEDNRLKAAQMVFKAAGLSQRRKEDDAPSGGVMEFIHKHVLVR